MGYGGASGGVVVTLRPGCAPEPPRTPLPARAPDTFENLPLLLATSIVCPMQEYAKIHDEISASCSLNDCLAQGMQNIVNMET